MHDVFVSHPACGCELEAETTMATRIGFVDGESARVLREHLEKLKVSITILEKRVIPL
jgi:hypothetical protein